VGGAARGKLSADVPVDMGRRVPGSMRGQCGQAETKKMIGIRYLVQRYTYDANERQGNGENNRKKGFEERDIEKIGNKSPRKV
jgi:hypothetical protein